MTDKGTIVHLPTGQLAVVEPRGEGWYTARILWAPDGDPYPRGGYDIAISPLDIAAARVVNIDDTIAETLISKAEPSHESKLIVVGKQFATVDPEVDEPGAPRLTWTITRVSGFTVYATADTGVERTFDYMTVAHHRMIHRFHTKER